MRIIRALSDAGWSSLVARRAHNPKVVGSNPAPATISYYVSPYKVLIKSPLMIHYLVFLKTERIQSLF